MMTFSDVCLFVTMLTGVITLVYKVTKDHFDKK